MLDFWVMVVFVLASLILLFFPVVEGKWVTNLKAVPDDHGASCSVVGILSLFFAVVIAVKIIWWGG